MNAVVLIPARLESQRFPRKVLADRTGKTLIQHVYESAAASGARVVIATDSPEVTSVVVGFGGASVLTGAQHENGTSRLAEAVELLGLDDEQVVVNVQGDEPEIEAQTITDCVAALESDPDFAIGTIAAPIRDERDWQSPSVVKVVVGRSNSGGAARALYFSRAPIPATREQVPTGVGRLRHVGIYAYRVGFLKRYAAMEPTPLEQSERLEQLRALEHGYGIGVAVRDVDSVGIDTPEDYERFVARWARRSSAT